MHVFYSELAPFWPLLSPVEEYADEAAWIARVIGSRAPSARTLLELGSGGGHNAFHLAQLRRGPGPRRDRLHDHGG